LSYSSTTMHTRPWNMGSALLAATLLAGCAGTEVDTPEGDPALGEFVRDQPVQGDLYIEVTDASGTPLQPDMVELRVDGVPTQTARCMDDASETCSVWLSEFAAMERVSAWATLCGHRFGAALPLGPDVDETQPFEASVTIVAASGLCTAADPLQ